MGISANFQSSWKVHQSIVKDMPDLFSSEVPEKIINHDARDWLQDSLLSAVPNQFALTCSLSSNQTALESDYRLIGVESKAMRASRLAAEAAQRDRDQNYISGLEKQGFIVISPDGSVSTGIAATLNRLELLVAALETKNAELIDLKKSHREISNKIGKLQGDDLTAANQKLASIQAESASLAERMRKDGSAIGSIALTDRELVLAEIESRVNEFVESQRSTLSQFKPLLDKASAIVSQVALPEVKFTGEQEKLIGDLMNLLKVDRDKAISILKGQGKL
jgi:hypothetical protein